MKRLSIALFISLIFSGCLRSEQKEKKVSPAKVEMAAPGKMPQVVLTVDAEKRLGIEVISIQSGQVPPAAILYDLKGVTWAYARTAPQTYSRVRTDSLKKGQIAADVVVRGAAELFGAESGVGK